MYTHKKKTQTHTRQSTPHAKKNEKNKKTFWVYWPYTHLVINGNLERYLDFIDVDQRLNEGK
jgi:hypothetical protein